MQIVIDIDEELYKTIKKNGYIYEEEVENVALSVIGGTPLPKGHGRLIDANAFIARIDGGGDEWADYASYLVDKEPTVIGSES
jgi:hypothetical protein